MFKKLLYIVTLLIIILGIAFYLQYSKIPKTSPIVATSTDGVIEKKVYTTFLQNNSDIFKTVSIDAGATLSPGTVLRGEARGQWYFEASFPVELRTVAGVSLWKGVAQAQTNWMTTDYVPFSVVLSYTPLGTSTNAILVLKKDNPSGDAIRDDELHIPVILQ